MFLHSTFWSTSVLGINSEGTLLLDGSHEDISSMGVLLYDNLSISINGNSIIVPYVEHELAAGLWDVYLCASIGERKGLFLVMHNGNLSIATGTHIGSEVIITANKNQNSKFNYIPPIQLLYNKERIDGQSELDYANFRMIDSRNIKQGVLYRGVSPLNHSISPERSHITDRLCLENRISAIVDLVDTSVKIDYHINNDFESKESYAAKLYFSDNVYTGLFPRDLFGIEARQQLSYIFHFLNSHNPPFFIHCNGGLYRTGFLCFIIEGLMGAGYQELIYDYMTSYVNFYGIKRECELYQLLANLSPLRYLYVFSHLDSINNPLDIKWEYDITRYRTLDISKGIEEYLIHYVHLSKQDIENFKRKITI